MLEKATLLLGRWEGLLHERARRISHPDTQEQLGLVRTCRPSSLLRRWLRLFTLEVFETEDEALVCCAEQHWLQRSRWVVYDAEGSRLGRSGARAICDRLHQIIAVRKPLNGNSGEAYFSPAGVELATLEHKPNGGRLTYAIWLEGEPFPRMLLLVAAVTSDW